MWRYQNHLVAHDFVLHEVCWWNVVTWLVDHKEIVLIKAGLTHKDQNLLKGFNHWEVRKELQDSFNALINAAAQAGKYKLAESLFSEVLD